MPPCFLLLLGVLGYRNDLSDVVLDRQLSQLIPSLPVLKVRKLLGVTALLLVHGQKLPTYRVEVPNIPWIPSHLEQRGVVQFAPDPSQLGLDVGPQVRADVGG